VAREGEAPDPATSFTLDNQISSVVTIPRRDDGDGGAPAGPKVKVMRGGSATEATVTGE
jgi:hypothetical protein